MKYGIDISEFQGPNYHIPKDIDFIIIRAGYGDYEDAYFRDNYAKAKALDLPIGIYWCVDPDLSAATQQMTFMEVIQNFPPTMGLWIDLEAEDLHADPFDMVHKAEFMCESCERSGYYTGIYYSASCAGIVSALTDKYDSWIACWDDDPEDKFDKGTLKQYAVEKNIDRDVCYYDDLSFYNNGPVPKEDLKSALTNLIKSLEDIIDEFC